ncbi:MAG TPA: transaldolase family protein [Chlamydiales bacterium]|nr:transaldolase family protein [Chlamydiales bacterium]
MEIWLDSTNVETIREAANMGILHGITTNPTILSKSNVKLEELLKQLLDIQSGPITIQVVGKTAPEMISQAKNLHAFSPRILIKIPCTQEGFKAMKALSSLSIRTMATAAYTPLQAFFAYQAGAEYTAIYLSRIADAGADSMHVMTQIQHLRKNYSLPGKLLAASIRFQQQVEKCLEIGVNAITIDDKLFKEMMSDHPLTIERLQSFEKDWQKVNTGLMK